MQGRNSKFDKRKPKNKTQANKNKKRNLLNMLSYLSIDYSMIYKYNYVA